MAENKRIAKVQELRAELAELQKALGELEVTGMNSGKGVSFRYIAKRISEIVEALCEMESRVIGQQKQDLESKPQGLISSPTPT